MTWGNKRGKRQQGKGWGWGGSDDEGSHVSISQTISGIFEVVSGGVLRSGKTSYEDTAAGWWIGRAEDGTGKVNIGNASYYLKWTGTVAEIAGSIGGSITEIVLSTAGVIRAGKTTWDDQTSGFWLGISGGVPRFHVGNSLAFMWFDPLDSPPLQYKWSGAYIQTATIPGSTLEDGAVDGDKLAPEAVDTKHFVAGGVDADALASGAVTAAKIGSGAVGSTALASSAVTSTKIGAGAVGSGALASGAVTEAKIDTGAVTSTKIGAGAVGSGALASGAVTEAKIDTGAVTSTKIGSGAVGSGALAAGAVGTAALAAGAVTGVKMDFSAGVDIESASSASPYTASRFRWLNGSAAEIGYMDVFYYGSDQQMYQFVGRPPSAGSAVGAVSYTLDLRAGSGENAIIELIADGGLIQIANAAYTGSGNHVAFDDIQEILIAEAFLEIGELASDPAAPATGAARLYCRDNGSGKTQLVVRFPTGAVQVLATEP